MATKRKKLKDERKQIDDFAELFPRQNWRIRQAKDGEKIKPWTRDQIVHEVLSLYKDDKLDEILGSALEDRQARAIIVNSLAKAMVLDELEFQQACQLFWFSGMDFVRHSKNIEKAVDKAVGEVDKRELAKKAILTLSPKIGLKRSKDGYGETLLTVENPRQKGSSDAEPLEDHIPKRLIDVYNLLEGHPYKQQTKSIRTSIAYRISPDVAEIIKLGAAACDVSATVFIEKIVKNYTHSLVRGYVTRFDKRENLVAAEIGKSLYTVLNTRYGAVADFPLQRRDKNTNSLHDDGLKWYPHSDLPKPSEVREKLDIETQEEAIELVQFLIHQELKNSQERTKMVIHGNQCCWEMVKRPKQWPHSFHDFMSRHAGWMTKQKEAADSVESVEIDTGEFVTEESVMKMKKETDERVAKTGQTRDEAANDLADEAEQQIAKKEGEK